jgi:hypothetical protein
VQATPSRRRPASLCSVSNDDCTPGAKVEGHGLCSKHYQRWQKHGDPLWVREPRTCHVNQNCTVDGKLCHGLCDKHYWRWRKFGDPLREAPVDVCTRCGGPLLVGNKYGVCVRNADCKAEKERLAARAQRKANPGRAYENNKRFQSNNPLKARIAVAISSAQGRVRKNGLPFNLKRGDLPPIPTTCPVLGIELIVWGSQTRDESPSLDRIIPSLGYVPGNVRWISTRANILRRDATARELALVAQDAMKLEEAAKSALRRARRVAGRERDRLVPGEHRKVRECHQSPSVVRAAAGP